VFLMNKKGTYLRRGLSILLSLVLVFTMLLIGITSAVGAPGSLGYTPIDRPEPEAHPGGVVFLAPEVIYLMPGTANSGTATWRQYADQFADGTPRPTARTHGSLMFHAPGAETVRIEALTTAMQPNGQPLVVTVNPAVWLGRAGEFFPNTGYPTSAGGAVFGGETVGSRTHLSHTVHYHLSADANSTVPSTPGGGYLLTWRATYVIEGVAHTAITHSYVYRPVYTPTAWGIHARRGSNTSRGRADTFMLWVNGLHQNLDGPQRLFAPEWHPWRIGHGTQPQLAVYIAQ
jgi:hypothetical protein